MTQRRQGGSGRSDRQWRLPILPSLGLFLAIVLVGVPAFIQSNNLLMLLLAVVVAVGITAVIASRLMLTGLTTHRILPRHAEVGQAVRIRYMITNRGKWLPTFCVGVTDTLPEYAARYDRRAWVMHIGPGDTVHGDAQLVPLRRGRLRFTHMTMTSTFPYGLLRRRRRIQHEQELVVFPRRYALRGDVLRLVNAEAADGPHASRVRGAGQEWYGTRLGRSGDGWRDVAWKASAHRGQLVALDRVRPGLPRAMVLLDLTRLTSELVLPDGVDAQLEEERAIELAASLLADLHRHGHEVGLTVALDDVQSHAIRSGTRHLQRLLGVLADVDLSHQRGTSIAGAAAPRAATIVVQPDRVRPIESCLGATYLVARRLEDLRLPDRRSA